MMQDTDLEDTSLGFVQLFTSSLIRFEMSLLFLVILILELKAFILNQNSNISKLLFILELTPLK